MEACKGAGRQPFQIPLVGASELAGPQNAYWWDHNYTCHHWYPHGQSRETRYINKVRTCYNYLDNLKSKKGHLAWVSELCVYGSGVYALSSEFAISSVSGYSYGVQRNVGNELIFTSAERYLDRLKDRPLLLTWPWAHSFLSICNEWQHPYVQILGEGHKMIESDDGNISLCVLGVGHALSHQISMSE